MKILNLIFMKYICWIGWVLCDRLKFNVFFYIFSREKGVFIIKMFIGEK